MAGDMSQYSFLIINEELFGFQQKRMPLSEGSSPVDAYLSLVMAFLLSGGPVTDHNTLLDRPRTWFHGRWVVGGPEQYEFTREDWAQITAALEEWGVDLPKEIPRW